MTSRSKKYREFIAAATAGNADEAQRFVAPGFRATLNEMLVDLSFREFMNELARQREAFSNLGANIEVMDTREEDDRLVITYTLTVTFDGPLRSQDRSRSVPPTGETLRIPSQDRVVFDENGRIVELEIVTDMGHTLAQMLI